MSLSHHVSESLYERAAIIGGRSCTRSKAPDRLRKAWAADAYGAVITDTEDREYLDLVCGLGALSIGYHDQRPHLNGGVYSLPHWLEVEAAEQVLRYVAPWASSVRFLKTGSEATHAAYRIAKAATGRSRVLVGSGAYHGWHEWTEQALTYPVGMELFAEEPSDIAAVFVEPPRFATLNITWLRHVRSFCDRIGALMVVDEMIWGGRFALGGCTEYSGVMPDLACYGKAFGNGEAVAFVVGREALAEHGEIVSGTFSGDVTGLNAVVDTLHTYTSEPVIETLWARARQLHAGLSQVIPPSVATLSAPAPLFGNTFTSPEIRERFKDAMHERGVLIWPDWWMTMYAHTEQQINQVIATAEAVCRTLS